MEFPENSPDLERGKLNIAMRFRTHELSINTDLNELAVSGFADKRLCALAKSELEKAFLLIEKALRLGAPDDYAKQPFPEGGQPFRQRVDPHPHASIAGKKPLVEWHDAKDDSTAE